MEYAPLDPYFMLHREPPPPQKNLQQRDREKICEAVPPKETLN